MVGRDLQPVPHLRRREARPVRPDERRDARHKWGRVAGATADPLARATRPDAGHIDAGRGEADFDLTGADRALTGMQNQRPNQVLDDPYGDRSLTRWLNSAAFAQPALGTHGNAGRNAHEGPGRRVVDLSLVRSFEFGTQRLEARVEAFNAFNWFRWGNPVTNLSAATFGRILTAGDPRIMQFALKYTF